MGRMKGEKNQHQKRMFGKVRGSKKRRKRERRLRTKLPYVTACSRTTFQIESDPEAAANPVIDDKR